MRIIRIRDFNNCVPISTNIGYRFRIEYYDFLTGNLLALPSIVTSDSVLPLILTVPTNLTNPDAVIHIYNLLPNGEDGNFYFLRTSLADEETTTIDVSIISTIICPLVADVDSELLCPEYAIITDSLICITTTTASTTTTIIPIPVSTTSTTSTTSSTTTLLQTSSTTTSTTTFTTSTTSTTSTTTFTTTLAPNLESCSLYYCTGNSIRVYNLNTNQDSQIYSNVSIFFDDIARVGNNLYLKGGIKYYKYSLIGGVFSYLGEIPIVGTTPSLGSYDNKLLMITVPTQTTSASIKTIDVNSLMVTNVCDFTTPFVSSQGDVIWYAGNFVASIYASTGNSKLIFITPSGVVDRIISTNIQNIFGIFIYANDLYITSDKKSYKLVGEDLILSFFNFTFDPFGTAQAEDCGDVEITTSITTTEDLWVNIETYYQC